MGYIWLTLSWLLYFAIHSLLASDSVKKYFTGKGMSTRNYRLIYNFVAVVTLLPIILLTASIPKEMITESEPVLKSLGMIVAGYGVVLGRIAFKSYDTKAFLGLGDMKAEQQFSTEGMLRHMRHPLYAALLLIIIGYVMFHPTYAAAISGAMLSIYIFIGIRLEERKLTQQFGEQYIEYKKKTPMLIPRFRK